MMAVGAARKTQFARGPRGRGGFTLVEVLVVLAVLTILFAMLFAPMIASLDMVTAGQAKVTMQTSTRTAMNEMRRELSNAMYIYPVAGLTMLGPDGILGSGDEGELFIPNYSEIAFVGPEVRNGSIVEPLAPRTSGTSILVTVLSIELLEPDQPYSRNNPFVLVRKEGTSYQQWSNAVWGGDGSVLWWGFHPDEDVTRNILTARGSYDIPVAYTQCRACGYVSEGYVNEDTCPACGATKGSQAITTTEPFELYDYVHANVQFKPERIVGETLQASANETLYQARHGAWAGFYNRGNVELNDLLPSVAGAELMKLGGSELDPRLIMLNPANNWDVVRDSWQGTDTSNTIVTWDSDAGVVQVGATTGRWANVTNPNDSTTTGDGDNLDPGEYYTLQVQNERPDIAATAVDSYDENGTLSGVRSWDLVPIYPSVGMLVCPSCGATYPPEDYNVGDPCPSCGGTLVSTAGPDAPAMPIAYRIDPTMGGVYAPAKIVPGNVRVVVWGTDTSGRMYQTAYSETSNINQAEIGPEQFAVVLSDYGQRAEVRFSELNPPSPRMLKDADITVQEFGIYIQYYYRRNYDPTAPETDYVIRADYSTQQIMNLRLALQRYIEPIADPDNTLAQIIPPDATPDRVSLEDQAQVRNLTN